MEKPRPIPTFIELFKDGSSKRSPLFDGDGKVIVNDSNIEFASVFDVAVSPDLQKQVVNKRQLRSILRWMRQQGFPVVI